MEQNQQKRAADQAEAREEDRKLILDAQQDSKAFTRLYTKYWQDVRNYFLRHVGGDKTSADDLAQDTFFRALRYLPVFRIANASYRTYLLRIAHNLLVNFYRKKKTASLEEAGKVHDKYAGKFQDVIARDNLWQSVKGLSEIEQQVLKMMYQEELSAREISLLLNKTENAVKLVLSRARAKLRDQNNLR